MSLLQLPTEVLIMIIEKLKDKQDLKSLMMVNKQFHDLTVPVFYTSLEVQNLKQGTLLVKTLNDKLKYLEYIKTLSLNEPIEHKGQDYKEYMFNNELILDLVNTKMKNLEHLFLQPLYFIPYKILKNFTIFDQLIGLESSSDVFDELCEFQFQFPNLKYLKISFSLYSNSLQYLGFPYIEYEMFNDFFEEKLNRTESSFAEEKDLKFLLSPKEEDTKTFFPRLQKLVIYNLDEKEDELSVYMLLCANIGLPSLQYLNLEKSEHYKNEFYTIKKQVLKKVLSKRPANFRFSTNYKVV